MAYPVFLLLLTIPALEWLLAPDEPKQSAYTRSQESRSRGPGRAAVVSHGLSRPIRLGFLGILLVATVAQAIDIQLTFRRQGTDRVNEFDTPYSPLSDAATR